MWPWEHLAVGYLLLSWYMWVHYGRPPSGTAVVVLAISTQLPDLVDKPLAWTVGILPSGTSLAHSALTAALLSMGILRMSRRRGRPTVGDAFAIGYVSHLVGDVGYRLLVTDEPIRFLLWPLVPQPRDEPVGFTTRTFEYLGEFGTFLGTGRGILYLLFELALLGGAVLLWRSDQRQRSASEGTSMVKQSGD